MPRNEDSQNLKPLSTLERNLTFEAQESHAASWQAQKHTPPIHRSPGIPKTTLFD